MALKEFIRTSRNGVSMLCVGRLPLCCAHACVCTGFVTSAQRKLLCTKRLVILSNYLTYFDDHW